MSPRQRQQGSLIIAAVFIIVVVGFLATALTFMYVGNSRATADNYKSAQALYIAESGLERGIRQWSLNNAYTGETANFGGGTFSITVSDRDFNDINPLPNPVTQRRIISVGTLSGPQINYVRQTQAIVQASTSYLNEPFPNLSRWGNPTGPTGPTSTAFCPAATTPTAQNNNGAVVANLNAPGSTGLALQIENSPKKRVTGYNETTLTTTIGAGTALSLSAMYRKNITLQKNNPTPILNMAIDLVATDGTLYRLWSNCAINGVQISNTAYLIDWTSTGTINWTVPAGKTIDRVRLAYDVEDQIAKSDVAFDDIRLIGGGGGVTLVSWREILP